MKKADKVDKNVCFEILKRSLRTVEYYKDIKGKIVFIGQAKDWQAYNKDPNYQEELRRNKIFPDTEIAIFDQGNDIFCIVKKRELSPKYIKEYEISSFVEKARLIEEILNSIKPIPKNAPKDVQDATDVERQALVLRAGWNNMSIEELKTMVEG